MATPKKISTNAAIITYIKIKGVTKLITFVKIDKPEIINKKMAIVFKYFVEQTPTLKAFFCDVTDELIKICKIKIKIEPIIIYIFVKKDAIIRPTALTIPIIAKIFITTKHPLNEFVVLYFAFFLIINKTMISAIGAKAGHKNIGSLISSNALARLDNEPALNISSKLLNENENDIIDDIAIEMQYAIAKNKTIFELKTFTNILFEFI